MTPVEQLQRLLTVLGWTMWKMAAHLGEHPTSVRRWNAGKGKVPPRVIAWMSLLLAPSTAGAEPTARTVAKRLEAHPLPEGWERKVEILPAKQSGKGREVARALPRGPDPAGLQARKLEAEERARAQEQREKTQAERRRRALQLKLEGKSYPQIGAELGISHQMAFKLVQRAEQEAGQTVAHPRRKGAQAQA